MNEAPFQIESPVFCGDLANLQLPDPDLLQYYQNLKDRILWVEEEIDWDTVKKYAKQILIWNTEDKGISVEERTPIKVFINSPGGDIYSTLSLYHTMLASVTKIITINMGEAASGGSILFLGGQERFALRNSVYMVHGGSVSVGGTTAQVQETVNAVKRLGVIMKEIYLTRTNIDEKLYKKMQPKEWYMFDEEQVNLGIAHKMVESLEEII